MKINFETKKIYLTFEEFRAVFLFSMLRSKALRNDYTDEEIKRYLGFYDSEIKVIQSEISGIGYELIVK